MANLMSNAAKFSPKGSAVVLGIEDRGEAWRVCVTDVGPGIPDGRAQDAIRQLHAGAGATAKQQEGTGLGLAICREIVSRIIGHIAFDSGGQGLHLLLRTRETRGRRGRRKHVEAGQCGMKPNIV
jgi:signal transduction histidine kinase